MKILVTGASGFLGLAVCQWLHAAGHQVLAASRQIPPGLPVDIEHVRHADLDSHTDWSAALIDIDVIVHCAARAHVMHESADNPLELYLRTNCEGTLALARQAAQRNVKRLIFISSIKVNGETTTPGKPFTAKDIPAPVDPYGISKAHAESGLRTLAQTTDLEYTIIRPPLIYGPGVKANFAALIRAIQRGLPLPLGRIQHNRRSLVALENLLSLIQSCLDHPHAANQTFLVSDDEDLSSAELARRIGNACGRPARLIPVSTSLMKLGATLLGRRAVVQRLTDSLQVDIRSTKERLNWSPVIDVDTGLRQTIAPNSQFANR